MRRGITLMLPSEDAIIVAEELQKTIQPSLLAIRAHRDRREPLLHPAGAADHGASRRFWSSTGAITAPSMRPSSRSGANGQAGPRPGNIGPPVDPAVTTKVVEFNDVDGLGGGARLGRCSLRVGRAGDDERRHRASRARVITKRCARLTREHGTLLIIDETHTICAGPGGYTRAENLDPDVIVFGKAIGAGIPGAAYGFSQEVADRIVARQELENCDVGGIGGTLAGNALSLAAMRATLTKVLTKEAFDRMAPMAERWTEGVAKAIAEAQLPWHVTRLGLPRGVHLRSATKKWRSRRTMSWISNWSGSCICTR